LNHCKEEREKIKNGVSCEKSTGILANLHLGDKKKTIHSAIRKCSEGRISSTKQENEIRA